MTVLFPGYDPSYVRPRFYLTETGWSCGDPASVAGLAIFTDDEIEAMKEAVNEETERLRRQGRVNTTSFHPTLNQAERDLVALMGEYGIAKHFGLPLEACDLTKNGVTSVNQDYDLILPTDNGDMKTSVKSVDIRKRIDLQLFFTSAYHIDRPFRADYGVIVAVLRPRMAVLRGWFTRDEWNAGSYVWEKWSRRERVYSETNARPIADLLALRRKR